MNQILCAHTNVSIPPEFFSQAKAVFCGGKPYLSRAAQELGLQPDNGVPAEYAALIEAAAKGSRGKSRILKKPKKTYCTDTFEYIPHEFFLDGRAVWCGGKAYLASAAKRRGLTPDAAAPASYVPTSVFGATPTPIPSRVSIDVTPPPLPSHAARKTNIQNAGGENAAAISEATPPAKETSEIAEKLRAGIDNVPWTPQETRAPEPIPATVSVFPSPPTQTPTPTPSSRHRQTSIGLIIGQKLLGRYDVKKVLGKGAMGEVLHVTDIQSHIDYALKRLPTNMTPEKREATRRNFLLTSQLTHPHIATTRNLEVDPKTGNTFILMDLVRGQDLAKWLAAERLKRGEHNAPLPFDLSMGVAEQIASALDYAHSQPVGHDDDGNPTTFGVLHRDMKPANVMVIPSRQYRPGVPYVRIVDFGLATESQGSLEDISQPQRNKKAGTPVYMAPEQWEGRTLTRGVDQWALAVILYEMLSGERPFWDQTEFLLAQKIFAADPAQPSTMSAAQFAALKKTFRVNRRERHHSCLALIKALAAAEPASYTVLAAEFPMPEDFVAQQDDDSVPATVYFALPAFPALALYKSG